MAQQLLAVNVRTPRATDSSILQLSLIPTAAVFRSQKWCIVFAGQVTTPTDPAVTNAAGLHGRAIYIWGNIALNKSKTVKVSYRRL